MDIKAQWALFSTWAEDFLRLKEAAKITDRQKAHYRVSVHHWKDTFEGYQLDEIRGDDIEWSLLSLGEKGLSQRTINFYHSTLRQILSRAVGRPPEARRALPEEEQR